VAAAECVCVLRCRSWGKLCWLPQPPPREFGGIRQVLAQQLPQSQLQQFTLSPPSPVSFTSDFLSFVPIFSILSLSLFSFQ